jgi:hypothetical protein
MSFKASGRRSGDARLVVTTKARVVHNATEKAMVPKSGGRMRYFRQNLCGYRCTDVQLKDTLR